MSSLFDTKELLNERSKTHGNFGRTATYSQKLKAVLHEMDSFAYLADGQKEALECIMLKIARILSGNECCEEHWKDIAGYAELAVSPHQEVNLEHARIYGWKPFSGWEPSFGQYGKTDSKYSPDEDDESSIG